jgi:hypothetical protein
VKRLQSQQRKEAMILDRGRGGSSVLVGCCGIMVYQGTKHFLVIVQEVLGVCALHVSAQFTVLN